MRAALLTASWDDPWREQDVAVRRVAGAVACIADVDVIVPGERGTAGAEGPFHVIRPAAAPIDVARRNALLRAAFGPLDDYGSIACDCRPRWDAAWGRDAPFSVQLELLRQEGGDAPDIGRLLTAEPYDVYLFAGCSASTYLGASMVPDDKPVVFIPLSRGHPVEALPALDHAFTRADSVLTFTHQEAASVARRTPRAADKLTTIHLVCRVHESAHRNEPHAYEAGYHIAVVADWTVPRAFDVLFPWLGAVADDVGGVEFRPVGPGAGTLPFPHATLFAEGGLDMWRHIVRSAAVLDPAHHQLLGKTVLEALHYGVPVLVPTTGGATREHAELGNGGLWYRATQDLAAAIVRLRGDDTLRAELSDHGRAYAGRWYGDTQRFIDSVTHAVRAITG